LNKKYIDVCLSFSKLNHIIVGIGVEMSSFETILQTWDQAGQRPYLVLQELGLYDQLLQMLNDSKMNFSDSIFRGTVRHFDLQPGDVLNYEYATSWSDNLPNAMNFVDGTATPVILKFTSEREIGAVPNHCNTYDENEVIIEPLRLRVVKRKFINSITFLSVIPAD
jgi:hypothetical protein